MISQGVAHVFAIKFLGAVNGNDIEVCRHDIFFDHVCQLANGTGDPLNLFSKVGLEVIAYIIRIWRASRDEEDVR